MNSIAVFTSYEPTPSRSYPYIGVSTPPPYPLGVFHDSSFAVLFTAPNTGVVIYRETFAPWEVGHQCDGWAEEYGFTPLPPGYGFVLAN